MMNYKSETLRKNRTFFIKSKILEKVVKRVQHDRSGSEAHSKHLVPYCLSNLVSSKKVAFTLAEILITLGIIGVVAALTIPTISRNIQEMVLNNQFKKFYSTFKQAFLTLQTLEGRPIKCFYWTSNPYEGICTSKCDKNEFGESVNCRCEETGAKPPADYMGARSECAMLYKDVITNRLRVAKICEDKSYERGCLPKDFRGADKVKLESNPDLNINPDGELSDNKFKNVYATVVLEDGSYIIKNASGDSAGAVYIFDINGQKGPNKWGYDIYGVIFYGNYHAGIQEFRYYGVVDKGGKYLHQRLEQLGLK